ncbi:MAG: pyridoxamine 5'-phosphate oxidase family protein [Candidatus Paceibacterota bacterium]
MNNSIEALTAAVKNFNTHLGIISTVNTTGHPESAVVYFSHDDSLNIFFTTRKNSRKYKNLVQTPTVAFVVYDETTYQTVQIEGVASTISDPTEQTRLFATVVEYATKNDAVPPIDKIGDSEIMFIKITTSWARLGNFELSQKDGIFKEVSTN